MSSRRRRTQLTNAQLHYVLMLFGWMDFARPAIASCNYFSQCLRRSYRNGAIKPFSLSEQNPGYVLASMPSEIFMNSDRHQSLQNYRLNYIG